MKQEFQVGDEVEAFGLRGKVREVDTGVNSPYIVLVDFENVYTDIFTLDGRFHSRHKEPSLKLISRPKKKTVKRFYKYLREHKTMRQGDEILTLKEIPAYMTENFEHLDGRISSYLNHAETLGITHRTEQFIDLEVEW